MQLTPNSQSRQFYRFLVVAAVTALLGAALFAFVSFAAASQPVEAGYRDFSYGEPRRVCSANPTAEKPESKLWFHDGSWWGSLCNDEEADYHIYRFDIPSQEWIDTGVALDGRPTSRADVLWDETDEKLYVISHLVQKGGLVSTDPGDWGRLYRYSYDAGTKTYTRDDLAPGTRTYAYVNNAKSETLVLAKDSTGRLWTTYTLSNTVYVNTSAGGSLSDDQTWLEPFALSATGAINEGANDLDLDDISSIVAFKDSDGKGYIGVMWSNQNRDTIYFAVHPDNVADRMAGWKVVQAYTGPNFAEDHINIKTLQSDSDGNVFAVVKTKTSNPLIVLLVCKPNGGIKDCTSAGNWSAHTVYRKQAPLNPTRPLLLIDETNRELYVFVTSTEGGGTINYKSSPISNIDFGDPADPGTVFIASSQDPTINNATSTKQNLTAQTGLVVLASDASTRHYLHGYLCLDKTGSSCPELLPRVEFEALTYSVDEGAGTATITVTLDTTYSQDVTVDYATADDTATAPDDYTTTNGTLIIPSGQTSGSFTVPIVDDAIDEPDESVTLTLSNPSNAVLGMRSSASLIIGDNDGAPSVRFSASDYSVSESDASATISVILSAPAPYQVSVDYQSGDGTAVAGSDYTSVSGTLIFNPGDTIKTFDVPITSDVIDEDDETVVLTLTNVISGMAGLPSVATLTIVDDDAPPTVQFNPDTVSTSEGGNATFTVVLSAPSAKEISVEYSTHNGTAIAPDDYTPKSGTLEFAPGQTSRTFTVSTKEDTLDEPDETVFVELDGPINATLGSSYTATLTIVDNDDPPTVQFSSEAYSVGEAETAATITVTLSSPSAKPVTVNYTTSNGTARSPADYAGTSGTLTFNPGETSKSFNVTIVNDTEGEDNETVNLALSAPTNATLGTPSTALLTIIDDDGGPSPSTWRMYLPLIRR